MAALKQTSIDLHIATNRAAHNTSQYASKQLILRRGQPFKLSVTFNRALESGESLSVYAETVSSPQSKYNLSSSSAKGSWNEVHEPGASNVINFTICSPPDANIGHYNLSVQASCGFESSPIKLGQFILLFNPWCADDAVFMPIDAERKEYVLQDSGIIYRGNKKFITEMGWNFGQFEENILDLCLTILDKSLNYCKAPSTDCAQRNNPVYVGRVISTMVNCQDDDGVLEGNWSGDYSDGCNPCTWNGSVAILREWKKQDYEPVRYAQCWVFAGLTCTVLRCLGIPARVVTNFSSAHDTDGNLSIDEYYDKSGKSLNEGEDSIWNFHVWDEGWFARKDLGECYDGWQVLDATPQELSSGLYRCGPTSVKAIKEGDIELDYDAPFVFAEVNADRVSWLCYSKDKKERISSDDCIVGKNISTKAVGCNTRQDITSNYKYEDGSKKEREVFLKAQTKLLGPEAPPPPPPTPACPVPEKPDVPAMLKITKSPVFGEDVDLILILTNSSKEKTKKMVVNISASSILYTGRVMSEICKQKSTVTLGPKEVKELPFKVTYGQYEKYLSRDQHIINISAICEAEGAEKSLVQKILTLASPPISIKVLDPVVVNKPGKAHITFCNNLPKELTDCQLFIVGATLLKDAVTQKVKPIQPKETVTIPIDFKPTAVGNKQLSVNFSCNMFCSIKTFVQVVVVAK